MKLHKVLSLFTVIALGYLNTGNAQSLACPAVRTTSGWLDLFPIPCRKNSECRQVMGNQHLCCKGFCTKGIQAQAARKSKTISSVDASSSSTITIPTTSSTTSTTTTSTTSTTTTTTTTTTPPSTTSSTTTTTTTPKPTTTTEPPRPFLQLLPIALPEVTSQKAPVKTSNSITADVTYSRARDFGIFDTYNVDYSSTGKTQKLVCPKAGQSPVILFPIPCEKNSQCRTTSGPDQVCCEGRCVKGVPAPKPIVPQKPHQPLLGVIPRECPSAPLGELLFEVQTCKADSDCWPRICCPDGTRSYCRTARARLDMVPVANRLEAPVRMLEQFLQCTSPPDYDLFPQKCSSSVDCFPNLCCAEGGKKHCRPPQRSLLALLAGVTQTIG